VDNNIPAVKSVYTLNEKTGYPFGVGDTIDIIIEMTHNVSVVKTPSLLLSLEGIQKTAYYKAPANFQPGDPINKLWFTYDIQFGDIAQPLDYLSVDSLVGDIRRWTIYTPTLIANLKLASPASPGSLAVCCNIQIDSSQPYVDSLIPLKRIG